MAGYVMRNSALIEGKLPLLQRRKLKTDIFTLLKRISQIHNSNDSLIHIERISGV